MTSTQTVNPWTPEMIKKDKRLKGKYGQNTHIIPAPVNFTKGGDKFIDSNKIDLVDKNQKKNIKKILLGTVAVAATIVGTSLAIKYLKKGKLPSIQGVTTKGKIKGGPKPDFKLSDLKFEKGKAFLHSGEEFSGTVSHELKNGNKVSMVYRKGDICSSIIKDKEGKILTQKEYYYHLQDNLGLKKVLVDKNGIKGSVEIMKDWSWNGIKIEQTKVKTPEKKITFIKNKEVCDSRYGTAENSILTTGLRENMPFRKIESILGGEYPSAQIVAVEDAAGLTITRKFTNGMKDVLKLNKQGTTGTIKHFDENGKLVSKIERRFIHKYVGSKDSYFNDYIYNAKGDFIKNRGDLIKGFYFDELDKYYH